MNERIGKLVEQAEEWVCKNYPDAMDDNDEFHAQTMEKFAELIVQECVKHITDQQDLVETNWQCKDGIHIVYSLKEHFGVEE